MRLKIGHIPWNKGKKGIYCPDTRRKMSDAAKGRIAWNKGKHSSKETRMKISAVAKLRVGAKNSFYGKKQSLENILKHRAVASIPSIRMCLSCGRGFLIRRGEQFDSFARRKYCSVKCKSSREAILRRRQPILRLPYEMKLCLEGCGRPAVRHRGPDLFASRECYGRFRRMKSYGCARCNGTHIWKECKCPMRDIISHTVKYTFKNGRVGFKIRNYASRKHNRGFYPERWKSGKTKREKITLFRQWILRYYYRGFLKKPEICQNNGCDAPAYQLCPIDPTLRWERNGNMSFEDITNKVIWTCRRCFMDIMESTSIRDRKASANTL